MKQEVKKVIVIELIIFITIVGCYCSMESIRNIQYYKEQSDLNELEQIKTQLMEAAEKINFWEKNQERMEEQGYYSLHIGYGQNMSYNIISGDVYLEQELADIVKEYSGMKSLSARGKGLSDRKVYLFFYKDKNIKIVIGEEENKVASCKYVKDYFIR